MAASAATRSPDPPSTVPRSRSPAGLLGQARSTATCSRCQASSSLIWLEGINDFSKNGNASTEQVIAAMKDGVDRAAKEMARSFASSAPR